jgi:hypothetical protein
VLWAVRCLWKPPLRNGSRSRDKYRSLCSVPQKSRKSAEDGKIADAATKLPVKLIYSGEDDTTPEIYRSPYTATFRVALDLDNNQIEFYVRAGIHLSHLYQPTVSRPAR